jgi:hypothetical protein
MEHATDEAERRPGCGAGRLPGGLARLALVYPLVSLGSQVGQAVQRALWPGLGTPYEGAAAGVVAGAVVGLSIWRSSLQPDGWRTRLADLTLVLLTAVWAGALVSGTQVAWSGREALTLWAGILIGTALIAGLLRS